ncbi:MAG TPA: tRNA (guanosine(46)-N7)-methyltransferase TrmB [Brumimicrobium sp.]|nr:tRNA (guanosine(46)-N7)-methyltransferase TrmB [Brumimicrobium sp.]
MAEKKLFRFAEIAKMDNVLQPTMEMIENDKVPYKGNWKEKYFKNDHPITLELGCGKGEYAVGLARKYPNRNFIAVDIKGNRMYVGARQAIEEKLDNIFFLRTKIDFIEHFFEKDEVDEIWLTFSDPQRKKPRKRLTSKLFIDRYRKILKPKGIVHLKTDSDILFESTEEQIKLHNYTPLFLSWDLYGDIHQLPEEEQEILRIKTYYEALFTGKGAQIKYCKFTL